MALLVASWLAVWRITALICYDRGPFELVTRLRRMLVGVGLERLVTCFHCAALWVSLVVVGLLFEIRWLSLLFIFAVAGAASLTERWLSATVWEEEDD